MVKRRTVIRILLAVSVLMVATCLIGTAGKPPPPPPQVTKYVTMAICEDYDKGQDLTGISQDFQLLNLLEVDTMRISLGWDDYEPARGQYDFTWLHSFCDLAAQYGIKLRPYICYAAPWATPTGAWNEPPVNYQDWYNFCYNLALALKTHANVVSYEIWNEENDSTFWWNGTVDQYKELLKQGVLAIRAADPGKQIILGGLQWADWDFFNPIVTAGYFQYYDIVPIHCYQETWSRGAAAVEGYLDVQYYDWFLPTNKNSGGDKPIWFNEIGYATYGQTETDQANYMCRAVSYLFADAEIEHINWYEIKDLDPSSPVIGDQKNYYLGITTWPDKNPKLAFHTYDMLTDLLDKQTITVADNEATVTVTSGRSNSLYKHLFKRADGSQILFVYSKASNCTVKVSLTSPGATAYRYNIYNNTSSVYSDFAGNTISNLSLTAGNVEVFKIVP